MHVYTLVWLKSDWIGFLIVELKHPDYPIDSRITPACIRSSGSDRIWSSTQAQDFSPGPWAGSRRTAAAASFLQNHCKKERHCASSLCNYQHHDCKNFLFFCSVSLWCYCTVLHHKQGAYRYQTFSFLTKRFKYFKGCPTVVYMCSNAEVGFM